MRAANATGRAKASTKEAAALLGCSEAQVRRMIRSGELQAERVRGRFGMEYRIDKACLPGGARPAAEAPSTPAEPEAPVAVPSAAGAERKEIAVQAEVLRLTEERDQWQERWAQAQGELGRLSAQAERVRMLEGRADGIAQAEARAQAEVERANAEAERAKAVEARAAALVEAEARARAALEAAQRRERETARQERESRDLVEQARRRVEEVGQQLEEVLCRAAGIAQEQAETKVALEASHQEKEHLARQVTQLRERMRHWALVTVVAAAVAVTALVGLLAR
jgi:excisionase family DNA binding protein